MCCKAMPQNMQDYLRMTCRKPVDGSKKLEKALSAEKIPVYAPLLRWYLDHGLATEQSTTNR